MLSVRDVHFTYKDGRDVLKGVSARFAPGGFAAVLGPNGAGKTTLLKLLSGALKPQRGEVLLDGQNILKWTDRARARKIAVVSQRTTLDFGFTALDVVLMGRQPYISRYASEGEKDIRIAMAAMEMTAVSHLAGREVTRLSGGEWQRVVVARALCQQTPVMLLDEPVSALDMKYQLEVLALIRHLAKERDITAVCVLHDINHAAHFCDHLILMQNGGIYAQGKPEDVITPQSLLSVYGVKAQVQGGEGRIQVLPEYPEVSLPHFKIV